MKRKDDNPGKVLSRSGKPYLLVGAGPLTATIWKWGSEERGWNYRFNIVRTSPKTGDVRQQFAPKNVMHLAKLVNALAVALAGEWSLAAELRAELENLADCMERVLVNTKENPT
jgi:hypothetical protein